MFKKASFASMTPPRGGDYELGDGRFARVTLRQPQFTADHTTYLATAYLVDSNGNWVLSASGAPMSTPETPHSVFRSAISAGTASMYPCWVKYSGPHNTVPAPADWAHGSGSPTGVGAADGDHYVDDLTGAGWTWTMGEFERIRQVKVADLLARIGPVGNTNSY